MAKESGRSRSGTQARNALGEEAVHWAHIPARMRVACKLAYGRRLRNQAIS